MDPPNRNEQKKSLVTTGQVYGNPEDASGNYYFPRRQTSATSVRKFIPFDGNHKNRERAILKNGDCNIFQHRISKLSIRFLHDIFTTLVDIKWRWTFVVFALAYFVSWLIFALIWWLIMFTHGDLEDEHLPMNQAESNWIPCVLNIHNFTSCYLFSIETQYTIGYGVRTTTEECPQAIFMMSVQSIMGMMIDAFFIGIVFAKMTRPKLRRQTLLFSRNAVVCQQDGDLCLMFRVGDMRKNPLIGAAIRAQLIRPKKTQEGEVIRNYRTELNIATDGCEGNLFFLWPITVVHKIDEESPFYRSNASRMLQDKFEIAVVLEGTVESTGQSIQARTSYLPSEVIWGYKFEPMVDSSRNEQAYEVNYSKFDSIEPVDTPLCSAAELAEFNKKQGASEPIRKSANFLEDDLLRPLPIPRNRDQINQRRGSLPYNENTLLQFSSYV